MSGQGVANPVIMAQMAHAHSIMQMQVAAASSSSVQNQCPAQFAPDPIVSGHPTPALMFGTDTTCADPLPEDEDENENENGGYESEGEMPAWMKAEVAPDPVEPEDKPSTWTCKGCKTDNILKRSHCRKCNEKAGLDQEIDFVSGSRIFHEGDWRCTDCGNINWKWRETCNRCGCMTPALQEAAEAKKEEGRAKRKLQGEGACGGFDDRQDANDRNPWNSDDEDLDEFGRKKKKKAVVPIVSKDGKPLSVIEAAKIAKAERHKANLAKLMGSRANRQRDSRSRSPRRENEIKN